MVVTSELLREIADVLKKASFTHGNRDYLDVIFSPVESLEWIALLIENGKITL